MTEGNERLIIVLGMPRSGTTVLAYLLRQHPEVVLGANGAEITLLENQWLPLRRARPIGEMLGANPQKRVLLKRPGMCSEAPGWMLEEFPDAQYLYSLRGSSAIIDSWRRNDPKCEKLFNEGIAKELYRMRLWEGIRFGFSAKNFTICRHETLLADPQGTMARIGEAVGLSPFSYDVEVVGDRLDIKQECVRLYESGQLGSVGG